MNIGSVPYHAFPSIGHAISISQTGDRMSLPVSPSSLIYAQFKHVSGVPATDGVQGVNISKLAIIDTLVEQISRMKNQPKSIFEGQDQENEERINARIEQMQNQIRNIPTASANNPYAPTAPLLGAVFSISV